MTTSPGIGLVKGKFKDQSLPLHTPGVVQMGADTACGTQHYVIQDALTGVGPAGSPHSGQGTFYAELWHYRYSFLGRCITWSAFVKGTVVLSY